MFMRVKVKRLLRAQVMFLVLLLLVVSGSLSAITLKLASPFPEGSAWDNALKQMAAEWADITGGQVRMRIYPGGVAGDDGNMIRKMRFGQLDLAVLASFGLKEIVPDSFVMSLPGMIQSEEELAMLLEEYVSNFDQKFQDEGFRMLSWSQSGWAYMFTKNPVYEVDDLRQEKFAVSSSDVELAEIFKALGFNVVPVSMNEVMVGLQSGMITAYYTVPAASAVYQWFSQAPFMLNIPVAPVLGGLVITERAWNRIPVRYQKELQGTIKKVSREFAKEAMKMNAKGMKVMRENGLKEPETTAALREEWLSFLEEGNDMLISRYEWISQETLADLRSWLEKIRQN